MSTTKLCVCGCPNSYPKTREGATGQSILNNQYFAEEYTMTEVETPSVINVNVQRLPFDAWEHIFHYLTLNDVIVLSCTCKHLQRVVQTIKRSFDCSLYYPLKINAFINYALSTSCTSVNLNHCYWLKPREIAAIISKTTHLQHLHLVECEVNEECMEAICALQLTSLSITLTADWLCFFGKLTLCPTLLSSVTDLRIFYKDFSSAILTQLYLLMLRYCQNLEYLKVIECAGATTHGRLRRLDQPILVPFDPTGVPELKSLVLNVQTLDRDPHVTCFVHLICCGKVKPLQHVDLGSQSGYFYANGLMWAPRIKFEKSTLSLNCVNTNIKHWLDYQFVKDLIYQPNYASFVIENVESEGFHEFARVMVANSGKTLKEIHLKHHKTFKHGYKELMEGLLHLAINCSQITVIDVSGHKPSAIAPSLPCIDNATVKKHKALLNALTNLKNLEKLIISPFILHCIYYKSNGQQCFKALPLWKVTLACKKLMEIRLLHTVPFDCVDSGILVHEDSLYNLAHCQKLRVLHLACFQIISTTQFALSKITHECRQLRELVCHVQGILDTDFLYNKNIKTINTSQDVVCSETFLNNLSHCEKLEKLSLAAIQMEYCNFERLANVLHKLKNLNAVVIKRGVLQLQIDDDPAAYPYNYLRLEYSRVAWNKRLDQILKSLKDERPAFYYSLAEFTSSFATPTTHLHLT